ncbi:hypothetical protein [Nitrosophilus alvini]|uniref:hypothetical protein n=1 Tax=Nitrosophilus alvini TaxID=2714855 RepID=UPI00190D7F3E|nr:hypothetical protein [Nitrosophilus alvini]
MELKEIQMIAAITLGTIGTSLGVINLVRDIRKNRERVTISACPVFRYRLDDRHIMDFPQVSALEANTGKNPSYRNIGLWNVEALENSIKNGAFPNLIGFQIQNSSNHSIFLENVGLTDYDNRKRYMGKHYDAIQSIKAEAVDTGILEVKPNSKYTSYCILDDHLSKLIASGYIYPFVETQSRKKRIYSESETIRFLSKWLKSR